MNNSEIVLFHGHDMELVEDLKEFLVNLGLTVSIVINEASEGKVQNQKVKDFIKRCKLAIIVATFQNKSSIRSPRPNVIVELTLCLQNKSKDTIVLREVKGDKKVDLGSNLEGHFASIEFERTAINKLYIKLLKEIKAKRVLNGEEENKKSSFNIGENLHSFLDEMDKIWDDEFDVASKYISRYDWKTEKVFENNLDSFFLKYWDVFTAVIRENKNGSDLKSVMEASLNEAIKLAANTWKEVSESKLEGLEDYREDLENEKKIKKNIDLRGINQCLQEIQNVISEASNRRLLDPWKKIELYKKAIEMIDNCKSNN